MLRPLILLATALALAACGDLPRPFVHDGGDAPALAEAPAMQPIAVAEIAGRPGLAEAMVAALGEQDIPASLAGGGDRFLKLGGEARSGRVLWTLTGADGRKLGESVQTLPAGSGPYDQVAAASAEAVAAMVRGDDLGGADLAARPQIAVDEVTATGGLDAALLKRSLVLALQQKGIAVVSGKARLHVSGGVRVTPGMAGHDLVEVGWVVADDQGKELGRVNQGNSVLRDELVSLSTRMTHQIAEGGAEGVAQLVRMKR